MKQILLLFLPILSIPLIGQNVGINLLSPEYTLDVRSTSAAEAAQFNVSNNDKSRYLRIFSGSDLYPNPSLAWHPDGDLLLATYNDATFEFLEYMRIKSNGNIGIQIPNPEAALDIKGGDWNLDAGNPGDVRIGSSAHNLRIGVATGGGGAGITRMYSSSKLILGSNDENQIWIENDGNTGFGTSNPSQKIDVNGKIKVGDDAKAPTQGTIRFNATTKRFEGYDGTKWINLGGTNPYGYYGEFNFPDEKLVGLFMPGNIVDMKVASGLIALRSLQEELVGYSTSFPFGPIYEIVSHIKLFEKDDNDDWIVKVELNSLNEFTSSSLGSPMVLSAGRLLIGNRDQNEVIEYTKIILPWTHTNTFQSPDSSINEGFGSAIDIDGSKTIIGAPAVSLFGGSAEGPGKAYVYGYDDSLEGTLGGPGATIGDGFGYSVSLSGDRAFVGIPFKDYGSLNKAGAATVFNFFNGNWSTNNTFYSETPEEDEQFGLSVDVQSEDYLYVLSGQEGVVNYAVEEGYWELKEQVLVDEPDFAAGTFRNLDSETLVMSCYNTAPDFKNSFLAVFNRDSNNLFSPISFLINGNSGISDYVIVDEKLYTLGTDDVIYVFNY